VFIILLLFYYIIILLYYLRKINIDKLLIEKCFVQIKF